MQKFQFHEGPIKTGDKEAYDIIVELVSIP